MNSSFSKKLGLVSVVFFVLNGLPYEGKAWGFFMHKKINSHAIYILPPELMTLYKNNEFTLKVYATKPDNRRYIDSNEGPRHFIDLDTYMAIDTGFIGLNYMTAKELYSQCMEENHEFGQYDYWIDEELSYWENPLEKIWSIILDSHYMLFSVFSAEYCVSEDVNIPKYSYRYRQGRAHRTYSKSFCARYAELCEGHIEERYRQAVHAVASVWFTCWVDAGKPQFHDRVIPINPSDQDELNHPSSCDHH